MGRKRILGVVLGFVLISNFAFALDLDANEDAEQYYKKGCECYDREEFVDAIELFYKARLQPIDEKSLSDIKIRLYGCTAYSYNWNLKGEREKALSICKAILK